MWKKISNSRGRSAGGGGGVEMRCVQEQCGWTGGTNPTGSECVTVLWPTSVTTLLSLPLHTSMAAFPKTHMHSRLSSPPYQGAQHGKTCYHQNPCEGCILNHDLFIKCMCQLLSQTKFGGEGMVQRGWRDWLKLRRGGGGFSRRSIQLASGGGGA